MTQQGISRIFRQAAIDHYARGRQESVLPRLIRPNTFIALWLLLLLTAAFLTASWLWPAPTYTTALAVVSDVSADTGSATVTVLLPHQATLHAEIPRGAAVIVQIDNNRRLPAEIVDLSETALSPEALRAELAHEPLVQQLTTHPARVVVVRTLPLPPGTAGDLHLYEGAIVQAEIQTGVTRVLRLVPGLDRILAETP